MAEPSRAVFLSYASQDAEAAKRICDGLRAAGIEVWFDQSELRGGDAWDQRIRRELHDCALFIPVISANTVARHEGYFRLEWDLADQRTHMIARNRAFIVPVCVDATPETSADTPESFQRVQWIRLPNGETSPAFIERVQRLLSPAQPDAPAAMRPGTSGMSTAAPTAEVPMRESWRPKRVLFVTSVLVILGALASVAVDRFWVPKRSAARTAPPAAQASVAPAAFNPPRHSIAVLPFVNMSGDKEQEYFSDGLAEELLNDLARINELHVAARTSAFSFKGKDTDIGTIARKLNVETLLEGSVRRSAHRVRVTAQLINAVSGFHVWSETYDRNLGDVLKLQTEIAESVANTLKVTLLGGIAAKVELGGTHDPAAFDAYLRALKAYQSAYSERDADAVIATYTEAIHLDPNFALGYAGRSLALSDFAESFKRGTAYLDTLDQAKADAAKALTLVPELAEGHLAAAVAAETSLDFTPARQEFQRALTLAPGNARVLRNYGVFAVFMGESSAGLAATRRAVSLDPLNPNSQFMLGSSLLFIRHYKEALAAFIDAHALYPDAPDTQKAVGWAHYLLGNLQSARSLCESKPETQFAEWCLAVVYDKLGRHDDAHAMLAKLRSTRGDYAAYEYAVTYAQWGDTARALDWLETAMRLHEPKMERIKVNALLDPLRNEPRFQAIERALEFPNSAESTVR